MAHANAHANVEIPDKLYFRIGEVAQLLGVKPYVLRFWEGEFSPIRPLKSAAGQRLYRRRDVELLAVVKRLLWDEGFTIAGARKRLQELSDARAGHDGASDLPPLVDVVDSGEVSDTAAALTPEELEQALAEIGLGEEDDSSAKGTEELSSVLSSVAAQLRSARVHDLAMTRAPSASERGGGWQSLLPNGRSLGGWPQIREEIRTEILELLRLVEGDS